jgi:hypothetical protein
MLQPGKVVNRTPRHAAHMACEGAGCGSKCSQARVQFEHPKIHTKAAIQSALIPARKTIMQYGLRGTVQHSAEAHTESCHLCGLIGQQSRRFMPNPLSPQPACAQASTGLPDGRVVQDVPRQPHVLLLLLLPLVAGRCFPRCCLPLLFLLILQSPTDDNTAGKG